MDQVPVQIDSYRADEAVKQAAKPYAHLKRAIDLLGSLVLVVVLAPLFLLVILVVFIECPGQVFFLQPRLGRGGRKFGLVKFRTLKRKPTDQDIAGSVMALSGKDSDITPVGRFLRLSGLNELPQLFNIVKGEMSFVGPRPAVIHHEQYYTQWHRQRLEVTPGVTGLAQVCGRNVIPWGWRIELDRYYVGNYGFLMDLQILLKTFWVVGFGIGTEGQDDMYFDFKPPETDILNILQERGIMRTFLKKGAE